MTSFFHWTLRTSDVAAARAFYTAILGDSTLDIVQLHEQAVARGARPHWLGFLEVEDVDRAAAQFIDRGATSLAPKWLNPQGIEAAVMRDPGGAILALANPHHESREGARAEKSVVGPEVTWYVLHSSDVERTRTDYSELFGWDFRPAVDYGALGVLHPFAWQSGGPIVGLVADTKTRSGIHPHWLLHFRVGSLARALEVIRDAGGVVIGPLTLPSGEQIAVCDDPQGAAFALRQEP